MKKSLLFFCSVLVLCMMSGCGTQKKDLPELEGVSLSKSYDDFIKALQEKGFRGVVDANTDKTTLEGTFKRYGDCLYVINRGPDGGVSKVTMMFGHPMTDLVAAQVGYKILETEMVQMIGMPVVELGAVQEHVVQSSIVKSEIMEANIAIEYYTSQDTYVLMCYIYCD